MPFRTDRLPCRKIGFIIDLEIYVRIYLCWVKFRHRYESQWAQPLKS